DWRLRRGSQTNRCENAAGTLGVRVLRSSFECAEICFDSGFDAAPVAGWYRIAGESLPVDVPRHDAIDAEVSIRARRFSRERTVRRDGDLERTERRRTLEAGGCLAQRVEAAGRAVGRRHEAVPTVPTGDGTSQRC